MCWLQARACQAVSAWFSAASTAEVAAAAALLKRWLTWAAAASGPLRAQLLAAAPALARPQVVWGGFGGGMKDPGPDDESSYSKAECSLLQVRARIVFPQQKCRLHRLPSFRALQLSTQCHRITLL